jgi:hypothetical protein
VKPKLPWYRSKTVVAVLLLLLWDLSEKVSAVIAAGGEMPPRVLFGAVLSAILSGIALWGRTHASALIGWFTPDDEEDQG